MNAFQALELAGIITDGTRASHIRSTVRVVFLDGHAKVPF
jgi:hypothetical protein